MARDSREIEFGPAAFTSAAAHILRVRSFSDPPLGGRGGCDHCLIPGGALSLDRSRWTPSSEKFFFRVEPLAQVFRREFLEGLKSQCAQRELLFPGKTAALAPSEGFSQLLDTLYAKDWVVYM